MKSSGAKPGGGGGGGGSGGSGTPAPPPTVPGGYQTVPLSSRKAQSLDMSTVEKRNPGVKENPKRIRPHGLTEAPTFTPTVDEFKDPMEYIRSIAEEGRKFGIVKIIPPENWQPDFGIDTEVGGSLLFLLFSRFVGRCRRAVPRLGRWLRVMCIRRS